MEKNLIKHNRWTASSFYQTVGLSYGIFPAVTSDSSLGNKMHTFQPSTTKQMLLLFPSSVNVKTVLLIVQNNSKKFAGDETREAIEIIDVFTTNLKYFVPVLAARNNHFMQRRLKIKRTCVVWYKLNTEKK